MAPLSEFERGLIVGLLVGEGSFGGDGRQPQIVVKMHVRHERLLRWLTGAIPGSKLYGPYSHAGRHFFQWMARGQVLAREVLPILDEAGFDLIDDHAAARLAKMRERYGEAIGRATTARRP